MRRAVACVVGAGLMLYSGGPIQAGQGARGAAVYALAFLAVMHTFVVLYEEPMLRRTFGRDYEAYCERVGRWWPG